MKYVIAILLVLLTCSIANAWDGELSFGKYFDYNTLRAYPDGGKAKFVGTVEIGHKLFKILRPYVKLETIMDQSYMGENNVPAFHPSSIKYDMGVKFYLPKNVYIEISHMCWHPVDGVGTVEQYNLLKIGIKFVKR